MLLMESILMLKKPFPRQKWIATKAVEWVEAAEVHGADLVAAVEAVTTTIIAGVTITAAVVAVVIGIV